MTPDYLKDEFLKVLDRQYFSNRTDTIRKNAFDSFKENGLPDKKLEDWRFTDLSSVRKGDYKIPDHDDAPKEVIDLPQFGLDSFETMVFINGRYQDNISSVPKNVNVMSNQEYMEKFNWEVYQPNMSPFDLLNTAFMDSGICIVIGEGIKVDVPLRMLFISSEASGTMITPRIHLDIEESSSMELIEQHVGHSGEYLCNASTVINVENNASLNHVRIQNSSRNTINMANIHVKQHKDSNYTFSQFAFGGELSRLNLYTEMLGKNANCSISGLNLSDKRQHLDSNIVTCHYSSHCTSSQNFKSVLKDQSSGVFNGKSIVQINAEKTDSNQSNKNLLLSDQAIMNSNPQLEIHTDDVKCSHGSTTGELDTDALFYMRSRGIDEQSAIAILVNGFVSEIIDDINHIEVVNYLRGYFKNWIEENYEHSESIK